MKQRYLYKQIGKIVCAVILILQILEAKIAWLSLDELVSRSDIIVIALIQRVSVVENNSERGVSTLKNRLTIMESLKGSWPMGKPLVLITTEFANPSEYWEEDSIHLPSPGFRVLLFLKKDNDTWLPTNGMQGVWPLQGDKLTGAGLGTSIDQIREVVRKQAER